MAANTAVCHSTCSGTPDVPERLLLQRKANIVDIQVETILPPTRNPKPEVAPADRGGGDEPEPERSATSDLVDEPPGSKSGWCL